MSRVLSVLSVPWIAAMMIIVALASSGLSEACAATAVASIHQEGSFARVASEAASGGVSQYSIAGRAHLAR